MAAGVIRIFIGEAAEPLTELAHDLPEDATIEFAKDGQDLDVRVVSAAWSPHAEVFKGADGQFYARTVAHNGRILLTSEGYKRKADARRAAKDTGYEVVEV